MGLFWDAQWYCLPQGVHEKSLMCVEHAFQCGCLGGGALCRDRQMKMERLSSILSEEKKKIIRGDGLDFQTLLILVMLSFSVRPSCNREWQIAKTPMVEVMIAKHGLWKTFLSVVWTSSSLNCLCGDFCAENWLHSITDARIGWKIKRN